MIRLLRHISVRLWISIIIWFPLSFVFLTHFGSFTGGSDFIVSAVILLAVFFATGFFMNFIGRKFVNNLIKDAKSWERAGIYKKGEEKYLKALRIYDSFLLSPWNNKKTVENLTGSITKFSLAYSANHSCFDKAAKVFLSMDNSDVDTAVLWLEKLLRYENISAADEELLTRLAELHIDNYDVAVLTAKIFTNLNRCDFTARKIYRKALALDDLQPDTRVAVEKCLLQKDGEQAKREILSDVFEKQELFPGALVPGKKILFFLKAIFMLPVRFFKFLIGFIWKSIGFVKKRKQFQAAIKWGAAAIACIGLIIFMVSTFSRLFSVPVKVVEKNGKSEKTVQTAHVQKPVPAPFTIQVAAYLKKKYGDAYVAQLKSKGLDAYLSKAQGGGKTWFLVRISRFSDKKKARVYGKKLKQKGYIEDFFVDNTSGSH